MTSTVDQIRADAEKLKNNFNERWGAFRRTIAAHPLTAFWAALAIGLIIGHFV